MRKNKLNKLLVLTLAAAGLLMGVCQTSYAMRTRIVVLPFYVEEGRSADTGGMNLTLHYRRMSGFIENHLVSHNFEVIDPFARESSERELNRVMEKAREDSSLVSTNMAQRYGVDAVYIVWLKVKAGQTADGYYRASAMLDGKGYDSGGRSLGANVLKTFKVTRRDFDEAVAVVEKEVGDVVGRTLTAWDDHRSSGSNTVVGSGSSPTSGKGVLAKNIEKQEKYINVRLDQANEYELVETFGKVLNTVTGVVDARRYSQRILTDNPQACFSEWEVEIRSTDPFRLQTNMMKMVNDILDAGGEIVINGVPYRYSPSEMKLMMGLRPGEATIRSVQFIIDRERARDREFSGRHDPENANRTVSNPGFE